MQNKLQVDDYSNPSLFESMQQGTTESSWRFSLDSISALTLLTGQQETQLASLFQLSQQALSFGAQPFL